VDATSQRRSPVATKSTCFKRRWLQTSRLCSGTVISAPVYGGRALADKPYQRSLRIGGGAPLKPYRGPPMTLGNAAAARVRLVCGAVIAVIRSSPTRPRWRNAMAPISRNRGSDGCLRGGVNRHNLCAGRRLRRCAEIGPRLHQFASLLEQIAPPVGGLDLVLDCMGERHLDHLARIDSAFRRPWGSALTQNPHS